MSETLTPGMIEALRDTKPWARFLSIIGFLSVALMIVVGIGFGVGLGLLGNKVGNERYLFMILPFVYVLLGVLYLFPSLYLFRYASAIEVALKSPERSVPVENALRQQKSFWKFVGILALIMIVLYIPGIIAAIAIPNLLTATQRAKQKRTMADLRMLGTAVEAYGTEKNAYPHVSSIDALARELEPTYLKTVPRVDAWGAPFAYEAANCGDQGCTSYFIASGGKDKTLDHASPSAYAAEGQRMTKNFDEDLVYSDGQFLRQPEF